AGSARAAASRRSAAPPTGCAIAVRPPGPRDRAGASRPRRASGGARDSARSRCRRRRRATGPARRMGTARVSASAYLRSAEEIPQRPENTTGALRSHDRLELTLIEIDAGARAAAVDLDALALDLLELSATARTDHPESLPPTGVLALAARFVELPSQ